MISNKLKLLDLHCWSLRNSFDEGVPISAVSEVLPVSPQEHTCKPLAQDDVPTILQNREEHVLTARWL